MRFQNVVRQVLLYGAVSGFGLLRPASASEPQGGVREFRHQVTGLFAPDREADLRKVLDGFSDVRLVRVDFTRSEAVLEYDPDRAFPGATPEQIVERLNSRVRDASHHTFGVKPVCPVDPEALKQISIPVVGLDCRACSLAAYEIVARLKGVESATASFKDGLVTARIHPDVIDQVEVETALKERGVQIRQP